MSKVLQNFSDGPNKITVNVSHDKPHQSIEKQKSHSIETMSETEVKDWFVKNNINLAILDHLSPCTGIVLKQIYEMKKAAPEFYYQSLREAKGINLSAISLFTHFLVKFCDEN